jgi:hypothetical protein
MRRKGINRRAFLKGLGLTGVFLAAAGPGKKAAASTRKKDIPHQTLYRETEEFKKYYESLRH